MSNFVHSLLNIKLLILEAFIFRIKNIQLHREISLHIVKVIIKRMFVQSLVINIKLSIQKI